METRPEIKSLPRNRKCGNCRYFEPAPLWRKGWCRNPRLYDRRANHLVDASSIDCEQVFRARIYWEPIPSAEDFGGAAADGGALPVADTAAFSVPAPSPNRDPFAPSPTLGYTPIASTDTYKQVNAPASTYTQPRPGPVPTHVTEVRQQSAAMPQAPQQVAPPPPQPQHVAQASRPMPQPQFPQQQPQPQATLPQINRVGTGVAGGSRGVGPAWRNKDRERAPHIKPKNYPGQARKWLVENVPYYSKVDEPLSRIPTSTLITGVFAALLVLALIVFLVTSSNNKGTTVTTAQTTAVSGVADLMATGVTGSGATNYSLVPPTPTLSDAVAPGIVGTAAAPATAAAGTQLPAGAATKTPAVVKKAIVTTTEGMRIRDKPSSTGAQLSIVKVGEIVTIGTDAPVKDGDNSWYPVEYKGVKGWARSDLFKMQ